MAKPRCANCGGDRWTRDGCCTECKEYPTLGFLVADYIQANCVIPDGEREGEPFILTDEMLRYLLHHYRVSPNARYDTRARLWRGAFVYFRGSQLVRPQKWGKGPFAAAVICAEGAPDGPVLFDGWNANGQPVGRPWATPWIQVTAVSEDQTDNVWKALQPMIERGSLAGAIPDTGLTRINLPGGGQIEPVTSSARSRLGQRVTFVLQDETHSWVQANGGLRLADNQRRNVAGMGGRWLSTTNAWDPAEDSVAQRASENKAPGVYHDDVEGPTRLKVTNKAERRKAMKVVYGDSWWVDLDRIDGEIASLLEDGEAAQAERFFLNRKQAGESRAFDLDAWDARRHKPKNYRPDPGALIVIGVDGARFEDAFAALATEVETGFQWPLVILERPDNASHRYEHSFDEADGAIAEAFETYDVWRMYCDDQWIGEWVDQWAGRYGDRRVIVWHTNRKTQICWAVKNYTNAINTGPLTHDGDQRMRQHIRNARKFPMNVRDDKGNLMHSIRKDRKDSPRKIDAGMAGTISWEARGDAIADGATASMEPMVAWGD